MRSMLEGVRIIDLTTHVAGPGCTSFLCDLGAEVIKVEKPGCGDKARLFPPFMGSQSVSFAALNRGKKGITLDLKKREGVSLFKELIFKSDVLVEDFQPGTMEKFGLSYAQLKKINPKLVMCAITGYGQYGPLASQPAYDAIIQGVSGLMSAGNTPNNPATNADAVIVDISSAMYAAFSICAALFARGKSGEGEYLDVAKLDVAIQLLEGRLMDVNLSGNGSNPENASYPSAMPFGPFITSDGRVILLFDEDGLFQRLCATMQQPKLSEDPRFSDAVSRNRHAAELKTIIEQWTRKHRTDTLLQKLQAGGVPCAPVNEVNQLFEHPHIAAREMIVSIHQPGAGMIQIFGLALKALNSRVCIRGAAPELGADNRMVLEKILKKSGPEIAEIQKSGVMG